MRVFLCWLGQLLAVVVLVLQPAGGLAAPLDTCKETPKIPNALQKSYVGVQIPPGTGVKYGWLRAYELVPGTARAQVSCLQNFSWSGVQNSCRVHFPNPNVTDGVLIPELGPGEDTYEYGDALSVAIGIKGSIASAAQTQCRRDGAWDAAVPGCEPEVQCPIPVIAHGQLKPAQNFTYGSVATLECDAGYIPLGATTTRCLGSGRWHPRVLTCTLGRCPYPPVIEHADRNLQREFPVGTTVTYFCRSGYTLLPEVSPITTCLKNFTWSVIPKLCQRVQCPSPTIHHGREISPRKDEYTFGHQVEFQCDPSYVLRGSQRIQCWSDGTWRPPVPYCDKVCGPPPKITNGQHSGLRTEQFPYGLEVKYSCVEGLSLIGNDSIYCTSDDGVNLAWSGPAPECRVVRCPKPAVERGRMTPRRFTFPYGAAVRFSCDEGFVLHGDAESRCLADGSWHPPLPTCQPVLCPQPQVANGRLKSTLDDKMWYQTNAIVTFECLHGYRFSDDGDTSSEDSWTATCLPDGKWTPLPKCKKEGDADVCEEIHYIKTVFECGVPIAELKTLLEIQKLFLEIKKLKVELENLNKKHSKK